MMRFNRVVFAKLVQATFARFKQVIFMMLFAFTALLVISKPAFSEIDYQTIEWTDLMPAIDLAALRNQVVDHGDIPDSSSEPTWESDENDGSSGEKSWDEIERDMQEEAYQSALVSTRTVDEYNGKNIRLPGFIVPLEFDDELTITQFFLVPYFGACIHTPPPPPNQLVLVNYPEGIQMDTLYTPFWVSGELSIQLLENDVGTSAYALEMDNYEIYEY